MIAYTSGTTGRPKGAVHVHGGFLVKMASEAAYQADLHPDETLYWVTDMGWIMGPWEMVGAGCAGATVVLYEGAPDWPEPDRVWALGRAPPGERARRLADADPRAQDRRATSTSAKHDLSQPADPRLDRRAVEPRALQVAVARWPARGACRSSTSPAAPRSARASSRPTRSRRSRSARSAARRTAWTSTSSTQQASRSADEVGELVCKQPWPGMTRGIWGDPERYLETYWSMYPGVWRHGDWALIDEDGDWFLLGRSDDTINVAGKRLGPAEVESVLVSHPAVSASRPSSACPHETKGEAIWCFCVLGDGGRGRRRRGARRARRGGARTPVQAVADRVRGRAAEDPLGEDPAARRARGRDRRGPRRHVVGREPPGARRHPGRARVPERTRRRSGAPASRRSPPPRSTALGSTFSAVSDWAVEVRDPPVLERAERDRRDSRASTGTTPSVPSRHT